MKSSSRLRCQAIGHTLRVLLLLVVIELVVTLAGPSNALASGPDRDQPSGLATESLPDSVSLNASSQSRFGVATNRDPRNYDEFANLQAGWFHSWVSHSFQLEAIEGLEFVPTVGSYGDLWGVETEADLVRRITRCPDCYAAGTYWIVGNELELDKFDTADGEPLPDGPRSITPDEYAQKYKKYYDMIKGLNPSYRVGVGHSYDYEVWPGQETEFLPKVMQAYEDRYGIKMPIDFYTLHTYMYVRDLSNPNYEVEYNVGRKRQLMADYGDQAKPLFITELGYLPDPTGWYTNPTPAQVNAWMEEAFDWLSEARSFELGNPVDDQLLVQRWAWFTLGSSNSVEQGEPWKDTALINLETNDLTAAGETYAQYPKAQPELPCFFYGKAKSRTGADVPDGTLVTAWINGVQVASTETLTWQEESWYSFDVYADDPDVPGTQGGIEGDTVSFVIGSAPALQTGTWHQGEGYQLDLQADQVLPTVESATPLNGSSSATMYQSFATVVRDANGWTDISTSSLLFGSGFENVAYMYYSQNENLVYLRDDTDTAWLGGFAPGSANVIENSQVIVDVANTSVSGSGTDVTVDWNIAFKEAYQGTHSCQVRVVDDTWTATDWQNLGTWTVTEPPVLPQVISLVPDSGSSHSDVAQQFVATYSDDNGWADIGSAYLLVGTEFANSVYLYYDQNGDMMYLRSDDGASWLGGYAPGSANVISNAQATVNLAGCSVSGTGNQLQVTWEVAFKEAYMGIHELQCRVQDDTWAAADWQTMGTWEVLGPIMPVVDQVSPSKGKSLVDDWQTFAVTYSDENGHEDINATFLLFGSQYAESVYLYYSQNQNKLYLRNDDSTGWLGGYEPGSANYIENTRGIVDVSQTTVEADGASLTVNWRVQFREAYKAQTFPIQGRVINDSWQATDWAYLGYWQVYTPQVPPEVVSITPATGDSDPLEYQDFTLEFHDGNGWRNISAVFFLIGNRYANSAYIYYSQNSNRIYLRNDASTAWMGGYEPGSAHTIENLVSIVDVASCSVVGSGDDLQITIRVALRDIYGGPQPLQVRVADDAWAVTDWQTMGTWNVNSDKVLPNLIKVTPKSGQSEPGAFQSFTSEYRDGNGWSDLSNVYILIGSTYANSVYLRYYVDQNLFYMRDDASSGWLGGYAPGSDQLISNSQGTLDVSACSVSTDGDEIQVTWSVSFEASFGGVRAMQLRALDHTWANTAWQVMGGWVIEADPIPCQVVSVTPDSGASDPDVEQQFVTVTSHEYGWRYHSAVFFLVGDGTANSAYIYYNQNSRRVMLRNDADDGWIGDIEAGSEAILENSQVSIDLSRMGRTGDGDNLEITWPLTFKEGYAGTHTIQVKAVDDTWEPAEWHTMGSWTVNGLGLMAASEPQGGVLRAVDAGFLEARHSEFAWLDEIDRFDTSLSDAKELSRNAAWLSDVVDLPTSVDVTEDFVGEVVDASRQEPKATRERGW